MKELARLDFDTLSPTNVSVIEDLLLKWWLMDKPGAETATNILMRIQRTPQYLFVKRYISPDFVVDDIEQLLREAPAQDRWTWWWDTYGDKQWQPNEKVLQTLVKQLSINYKTPEEIKMFLTEVENLISPLNPWPNPPIVKFWVDETPEPFMELTKTDQWSSIPPRFRGHISTAIVRYNQDYVQTRCREIMGSLPDIPPNELHDFMIMVTANKVPLSRVKDTFLEIAKRSNIQNRGYFIYQLNFYLRDNKDGDSYLELICEATHNELCNDYCNHLAFCLHVLKKDWQISDTKLFDKLRLKIRPLIKDLEELDYHALEVVEFACGSDLDEYTALIEERINVIKAASKETIVRAGYDIIPFDGIPCIKRAINNQERFDRLMGKIVDWNTSDSLRRFDLSYLLKSISDIKDNDQTLMLEVWLRSKFAVESDQSFKEAISVMRLLEFGMLDESCYLLMLETGENLNVFDDAKEVFQWLLDSGLIKSGLGEIPEIFIQKLDACKRLMDKAAVGKVKSYLNECGEQIEQTITDHLSEAQEHLNPK